VLLIRTIQEKLRQKAAAEIKRKQQQRIIQQEEVCSSRSVLEILAGGIWRGIICGRNSLEDSNQTWQN
jgi:hypothetical protein